MVPSLLVVAGFVCGLLQSAAAADTWPRYERSRTGTSSTPLASITSGSSDSDLWNIWWDFETECSGIPFFVMASPGCLTPSTSNGPKCEQYDYGVNDNLSQSLPAEYYTQECAPELTTQLSKTFGDQTYLRFDFYSESNCSGAIDVSIAWIVDGACYSSLAINDTDSQVIVTSSLATLNANGSVTLGHYLTADCSDEPVVVLVAKDMLVSNECIENARRAYTNADLSGFESRGASGSNGAVARVTGVLVGLVALTTALLLE